MSAEMSNDPFNIVKEELKKSINKTKSLIESHQAILNAKNSADNDTVDPASARLLAEIRTNLKSINWDVEDLQETIKIASTNPARFKLTSSEIESRSSFVQQAKEFVQKTRQTYNIDFDDNSNLAAASGLKKPASNPNINIRIPDIISNTTGKNREILNESDSDDNNFKFSRASSSNKPNDHHAIQMQHQEMFKEQDKNIDLISGRVSSLKNISQAMQNELDDQTELLDELGREMDTADSRMNNVMKRITKVLHMSSDKRQWTMIGVLLLGIFILLILFAIL